MSAHVVPKAKPYPEGSEGDDDEEKTTIESGWEDEASTTVEQGEVAEKIRALGSEQSPITRPPQQQATGITSTGANPMLDEPTVDDQHANSQIAAIAPGLVARLVITQGNDVGQEVEIRPGKSYTIGRAIDNDVVLTDIAVSRKHFDLRFQDGAWVIFDRGSGNGTVVNGNVEDNPFMLASGDTIEIGNTVFRFDQPNTAGRPMNTFDVDMDEELSTVAGKPLRNDLPEPEASHEPMYARPKTLPPPTPIRPRSPSTFPAPPHMMAPLVQPASTMPLPQMAGRAPLATQPQPQSPTLLAGEPHSAPIGSPIATTFPGHPLPQRPLMANYPQYSELPPGQSLGPLMISPNGQRQDASTAHVSPTPYSMGAMMAQPAPARAMMPSGQLSKRTKMILGGVGLALLAGVTTIAVVSGGSKSRATAPGTGSAVAKGSAIAPQVTPLPAPTPETPKQEPPPQETPKQIAVVQPPKQDPPKQIVQPKQEPPKKETPKQEPPKQIVVKKDPPRETPRQIVKKDPPHETARESPRETPKKDPPKRVAAVDTGEARTKADALYRAKRFTEAANLLSSAAKGADESEAKELRHVADLYVKIGRGLGTGTAPAAKPTDAFPTLRQTENFDRAAGGAFTGELEAALGRVAPRAAASYLADKNYEQARLAVIEADKLGANTSIYKQALERAAADMYTQASKEASSDAASAKDKCQRILNFADPKSPWYQKAARLKGSL